MPTRGLGLLLISSYVWIFCIKGEVPPESSRPATVKWECLGRRHSPKTWGTIWTKRMQPAQSRAVVPLCLTRTGRPRLWDPTWQTATRLPWHPNSCIPRWKAIWLNLFDRWCPESFPFNCIEPFRGIVWTENFHLHWISHQSAEGGRRVHAEACRAVMSVLGPEEKRKFQRFSLAERCGLF
jgi:hypothetical protein